MWSQVSERALEGFTRARHQGAVGIFWLLLACHGAQTKSTVLTHLNNLLNFCVDRNKQMMGLGSLFGEGDLQQLDGDPVKVRQVVDRQVTALWEIL